MTFASGIRKKHSYNRERTLYTKMKHFVSSELPLFQYTIFLPPLATDFFTFTLSSCKGVIFQYASVAIAPSHIHKAVYLV